MIEEAYCSYEVSKLLKEKEFDEECRSYFIDSGNEVRYCACHIKNRDCYSFDILRPTHQMAMRWLREVHHRVISISMGHEENEGNHDHCNPDKWYYIFEVVNEKGVYREEEQPDPFTNEYATYEEAVEAALKYVLENLI